MGRFGAASPAHPNVAASLTLADPMITDSVCSAVARGSVWGDKKIDHDITKLVCNIADTALPPKKAAEETFRIIREIVGKKANSGRLPGRT